MIIGGDNISNDVVTLGACFYGVVLALIGGNSQSSVETPIQEKTGSCMEARPKGPSAFSAPGGKNKWVVGKVSRWSK